MQSCVRFNKIGLALMLVAAVPDAQAADTGTLHLMGLPAGAQVYVDGKAAQAVRDTLALAPGTREIQIEALDAKGNVVAYRYTAQAEAGKSRDVAVRLFPVQLAPWWPYRREGETIFEYLPAPPGGPGPEGEPGPAGQPFKGWNGEPTDALLLQTLKEALRLRMDALEAQAEDTSTGLALAPPRAYIFDTGRIHPEPPGPQGSPGPQGIMGLPANAFAMEDAQGRRLLDEAARRLQLESIQQVVFTTRRRSERVAQAGSALPPRLRLLTPAWSTRLAKQREASRQAALAAPPYTGTICPAGAVGPMGPHGAQGADGVLPADAAKLRVFADRAQRLLALLQADAELSVRVQRLKAQTDKTRRDMDAVAQSSPVLCDKP